MNIEKFNEAITLFYSEFESWLNNDLKENNWNYEIAIAEICQIMREKFHTSSYKMKDLVSVKSDDIDQIVKTLSKKGNYTYYRQTPSPKDKESYLEKWILRKRGGTRELYILFEKENYIFLIGDNFTLSAYSFETLRQAIECWAANSM